MPHPLVRRGPTPFGALAALVLCMAAPAHAQVDATEHTPASVAEHLEVIRAYLAEMHGPVAERLYEAYPSLLSTPHEFPLPPAPPPVPAHPGHVSADLLVHYQAVHGMGTLGRLHGTSTHPIGVGWLPHSMFAQGGGVYARWGYFRLLDAIRGFAASESG